MKFKQGMRVVTFDDKDLGRLEQVVLDPQTKEVSHIVVEKGFLFTEDKVVPLNLISWTDASVIHLKEDIGNLDELPPYEETHYVPLDEIERGEMDYPETPMLYWLPPLGTMTAYPMGMAPAPVPMPATTTQNIPEGTVALREGAEVYSHNDELIGHVDGIFTNPVSDKATHFTISQGTLLPTRRLVPMNWVGDIFEDRIILNVGKSMIDSLREYHTEQ